MSAIGVLWLGLMYVRSFKPAGGHGGASVWGGTLLHLAALFGTLLLSMKFVIELVWILSVSVALASLTYVTFERPIMRRLTRRLERER